MNRNITNVIRFAMDECLPPIIRDSKWFMWPFYYFAYRGKNLDTAMNFKSRVHTMTEQDYSDFYNGLNTISRNRATDLNSACIDFILDKIDGSAKSLIDVGCGNGFLLNKIKSRHPELELSGFDIKPNHDDAVFKFFHGNIEQLPFPDNSFDVVTCCHTVEHLVKLEKCISELKRIARKQLFIVTPSQRPFYYTLDEHVNFFEFEEKLTSVIQLQEFTCKKLWGDWMFLGSIPQTDTVQKNATESN